MKNLQFGDRGSLVSLLQKGLMRAGYPTAIDGIFGQDTREQLRRFQRSASLAPDGIYGPAAHHANEWITSLLLLHYAEALGDALIRGERVGGASAEELYERCRITMLPLVNPDGADLVTNALSGEETARAAGIAGAFPAIPFPSGWKANLNGVDLNLQYPALWDEAQRIKSALGYDRPAPRDYVGSAPLSAPESRAVFALTETLSPALTLSFHTQGEVIYWKFQDKEAPGSRALAELFSRLSGYTLEDVPYAASFAGYKDWFILQYDRPGFTVEAGRGKTHCLSRS